MPPSSQQQRTWRSRAENVWRAASRPRLALCSGLLASCGLASSNVHAQEIVLTGPLEGACPAGLLRAATPARLEWSYWASAGAVRRRDDSWGAALGLGAELDAAVLRYPGFPAYAGAGIYRNQAELRMGVWSAGAIRPQGGLVESGIALSLGATGHAVFGTFGLRLGAGYGAFGAGRSAHGNLTLTYGVRSVGARYAERGYCDPPATPRALALASVARLFVTHRRAERDWADWEAVIGVELSPTFLLPPYTWSRLAGGWHSARIGECPRAWTAPRPGAGA